MSVELRWANVEHTILLYDARGSWSWADLYAAVVEAHQRMDACDHLVHSIVDLSAAAGMGNSPLSHGRRMAAATHPRSGLTAFVQAPAFMRVLFNTLGRLYPHINEQMRFVSTREEAFALINEHIAQSEAVA